MNPQRRPLRSTCRLALLLPLLWLSAPLQAQPVLIDFELIPGMTNSPGATIPVESRLSDQYLATHGVRFSSGAECVAVVIHGVGTPSGTRIIGGSTPAGLLTYQQVYPLVAKFFDPTGTRQMTVTQASIRGDLISIPGTKTIEAFNLAGTLIASQTLDDSDPAALSVSATGIHQLRFYSSSATVGFDDLRFDVPVFPCPADIGTAGGIPGHDWQLDNNDFIVFIDYFFAHIPVADLGVQGGIPGHDSLFDNNDFVVFIDAFFAGCG